MRIGLLIYGSLDTVSGGYLYDRKMAQYLEQHGDSVEIISLDQKTYSRNLFDNFRLSLLQRVTASRLDLLLQDEHIHPTLFWLNQRLYTETHIPILSVVHHLRCSEDYPLWENWFYKFIEKKYLESIDGFIFNSNTTRGVIEHILGRGVPGVVAVPSGSQFSGAISENEIIARSQSEGPLRILFVGNVIPRKGLHHLLKALSMLPGNYWHLNIIGSLAVNPSYSKDVQRLANQLGVNDRINFLGVIPNQELGDLYRSHQVLAVPSSYEGYGMVYLEGMGFGLPAIASIQGAAHEVITHGEDGFLIHPKIAGTMAKLLMQLYEDRPKLIQMSLAAHKRYLEQPTWNQTGEVIRTFLQSTLNTHA